MNTIAIRPLVWHTFTKAWLALCLLALASLTPHPAQAQETCNGQETPCHSGDQNCDFQLGLSEILRIYQLKAFGEYYCDPTGEDGYGAYPGDQNCVPHSADFAPQDWSISEEEISIIVEIANSNGYCACDNPAYNYLCPIPRVITPPKPTTADLNDDFVIDFSEIMRVIQLYNSIGFRCTSSSTTTEDGYLPGPGANHNCDPHDVDYLPRDWVLSLSEILRPIQFYNSGGYRRCSSTEDGFCPGPTP